MNQTPAGNAAHPPIFAQQWAVRLGACLLIGLAAVLAMTFRDATRRGDLERTSENTGVGDQRYFALPAPTTKLPVVAAEVSGRPLYLMDARPIEVRETHVVRADRDARRELTLYQLAPNATEEERKAVGKTRDAYLLKVKPGEFVKVQGAAP